MEIGNKIKIARKDAGLSQRDLSSILNAHQVTVARWESGERKCGFDILKKIAEITHKPISWFFNEDANHVDYDRKLQEKILLSIDEIKCKFDEIKGQIEAIQKKLDKLDTK